MSALRPLICVVSAERLREARQDEGEKHISGELGPALIMLHWFTEAFGQPQPRREL